MHGALAKIKKPGKALWSDIQGSSTLLHLLIAALHCICSCLRYIVESTRVKEAITTCLAVCEHDMHTLVMIDSDGVLEHLTTQITGDTRWVAQAHPGDAWIRRSSGGISLNAKYLFRSRGCWGYSGWSCCPCCSTDLTLACSKHYTTR